MTTTIFFLYNELTATWVVLKAPQGDMKAPQRDVNYSLFHFFSKTGKITFYSALPGECERASFIKNERIFVCIFVCMLCILFVFHVSVLGVFSLCI